MKTRTDKALLILTALFVGALAVVAGAVSFAHMRELATHHDQLGWKSYAFPISVDGLEVVASLYLVVQRRAGRPTGPIPWVALIVGTAASLAANVAVGGADLIGKALAGWPAVSMLVSVKLLFSMLDHDDGDRRTIVRDDQRTSQAVPGVPGDVRRPGRDVRASSATVPASRKDGADSSAASAGSSATGAAGRTAGQANASARQVEPDDIRTIAHLIPAARAARGVLASNGRSLSRDALANTMRDDGHGVSNQRASLLLRVLKAEDNAMRFGRVASAARDADEQESAA